MFRVFDFANPDTHSPQRFTTTVPQQALFMMNSPFVIDQARKLVQRPEVVSQKEGRQRIQHLYRLIYGRPASDSEVALGLRFVESSDKNDEGPKPPQPMNAWERYAQVLLMGNEFVFVD
jgi:hypothetical protein